MDKSKPFTYDDLVAQPELQLREIEFEASTITPCEGIHQSVILMDTWGNEWDDTGAFPEADFRLVDDSKLDS